MRKINTSSVKHILIALIVTLLLINGMSSCRNSNQKEEPDSGQQPLTVKFSPRAYNINPIDSSLIKISKTKKTGVPYPVHPDVFLTSKAHFKLVSTAKPKFTGLLNENTVPVKIKSTGNDLNKFYLPEGKKIVYTLTSDLYKKFKYKIKNTALPFIPKDNDMLIPEKAHLDIQVLDVDQGLGSSYVISLGLDSLGKLLVGTNGGGLSIYDGNFFKYLTTKNGLKDDVIQTIQCDNSGGAYLGLWNGGITFIKNGKLHLLTEENGLANNNVNAIVLNENQLFAATSDGLAIIQNNEIALLNRKTGFPLESLLSLSKGKDGKIWILDDKGKIYFYQNNTIALTTSHNITTSRIIALKSTKDGTLVVIDANGELFKIGEQEIINISLPKAWEINYTQTIYEDNEGGLWLGTFGAGLVRIHNQIATRYTLENGLPANSVTCIIQDSQNKIWIGTDGGGLCYLEPEAVINYTLKNGLSNNVIQCMHKHNNKLWLGTYTKGINYVSNDSVFDYSDIANYPKHDISGITSDGSGATWIGTRSKGIYIIRNDSCWNWNMEGNLPSDIIWWLWSDETGKIWMATSSGIASYHNGILACYNTENGLCENTITSIRGDKAGTIYFTYENLGYGILRDGNLQNITPCDGFFNSRLWCIKPLINQPNNQPELVAGGWSTGITFKEENNFKTFKTEQGLSNDNIWSLTEDKKGRIWSGTERGIVCFYDVNDKNKIATFGRDNGLKGTDFFANSEWLNNNEVWMGSGKSLIKINTDKLLKKTPLKCGFSMVKVGNIEIMPTENSDDFSIEQIFPGTLCPSQFSINETTAKIGFYFSCNQLVHTKELLYSFLLEGYNQNWSAPIAQNFAEFQNLPAGRYTLKIRVKNNLTDWTQGSDIIFKVIAPWWKRPLAIGIYLFVIISAFYILFKLRIAGLQKRQLELAKEVRKKTKELRNERDEANKLKEMAEEQKELIAEKNKEIIDSINYAKRIQSAILPGSKQLKELFKNSFIYYRPKDIVAGDFFWVEQKGDYLFFAVADCTGHGVPGALVSVVCSNALTKAVGELHILEPGKILDEAVIFLASRFGKGEEAVRDGMDIALCRLNKTNNELVFAGANNPIWIISQNADLMTSKLNENTYNLLETNEGKLLELKPDKQPVGITDEIYPFNNLTVTLNTNDQIYLFSDGFADQFGGIKGKKLKIKAFKELMLSISYIDIHQQQKKLDGFFSEWKRDLEQIDDVCVMGIKL